jgi:hypothetical protein
VAERVHGILGYYDGVLDGVADYEGAPHAFAIAGDLDAEAPRYRLKPISHDAFELFEEYWLMWRRWEDAFYKRAVEAGKPAVLPEDRPRHDEIEAAVKRALAVPEDAGLVARGAFRPSPLKTAADGRWGGFEVEWTTDEVAVQPTVAADGASRRR